jgi:hypothetical protein
MVKIFRLEETLEAGIGKNEKRSVEVRSLPPANYPKDGVPANARIAKIPKNIRQPARSSTENIV